MKFEKYTTKSGKTKWKFYHYLGMNPNTGKADEVWRQGYNTQGEAREALLSIIRDYDTGHNRARTKTDKYRFEEVVELWLLYYEKQVKVTTFVNRKALLRNHILPRFKSYYINKIDVMMCQEAVNDWYGSFTEAARLVNIVSQVFKFAINRGFCRDNPMDKIIRPVNTHKKEYIAPFYEKNELQQFLKTVKQNESIKAYTMFHLLAFTGLRRGELFGLQWRDIDFQKKTLSVERTLIYNEEAKEFSLTTPKTKSSKRVIGIDDATIQVLLRWRNYQREFFLGRGINIGSSKQLIFTSQSNHYMTDKFLRRIIKRTTEQQNLPHITVHGFRHTHCSLLFEAGIDMQNVKERLGHSDIKTTMNIYAHVTNTERSKTADIFGDFMVSGNL